MDFNEYFSRGVAFFQEGKMVPALEDFEAALKIQPDNADLRQMIEMVKDATKYASDARQASANEAKHWAETMGITDVDKAIAEYKRSLAWAYYIRGLTFTSKEEHARAVEDYSEAIRNHPFLLAIKARGWANLEIENYDQAIEDFDTVIRQFKPDDIAQAKQHLARAYMERAKSYDLKGDYLHAIPDYEIFLESNPDDSTARELLEIAKAEMAKNSAKIAGVIHNQAEFDKFMIEYPQKLASEGYQLLDNRGEKAGELYQEFAKLSVTINTDEIFEYTRDPYKLLISRGELGVMILFIKKQM